MLALVKAIKIATSAKPTRKSDIGVGSLAEQLGAKTFVSTIPTWSRRVVAGGLRASGLLASGLLVASLLGCGGEGRVGPNPAPLRPCDQSATPVVMVHGFLASGDTWANHVGAFAANGYCPTLFHAFDWNSLEQGSDNSLALDAFVDGVRNTHAVRQVDLWGHSAGGSLSYAYLEDPDRAKKIRRYVHMGAKPFDAPPGPSSAPVATLNIWSEGDRIVPGADIPGAENVSLPDQEDHYAVATSSASFRSIYRFANGVDPLRDVADEHQQPFVLGRVLTLGENRPEVGARVDVARVDGQSGRRQQALLSLAIGDGGYFGPLKVNPDDRLEFAVQPSDPSVPGVRYFREPFVGDNYGVYLRTFPGPGSIAALLLNQIPLGQQRSALVVFHASRAFQAGKDSLRLNGVELLSQEVAAPENSTIALFVFDVGDDEKEGSEQGLFGASPFLAAVDKVLVADSSQSWQLMFNGRALAVPADPASQGVLVAVFD